MSAWILRVNMVGPAPTPTVGTSVPVPRSGPEKTVKVSQRVHLPGDEIIPGGIAKRWNEYWLDLVDF